jgi:hypothetical protein
MNSPTPQHADVVERDGVTYHRYDLVEASGLAPSRLEAVLIDGYPYWSEAQVAAARREPVNVYAAAGKAAAQRTIMEVTGTLEVDAANLQALAGLAGPQMIDVNGEVYEVDHIDRGEDGWVTLHLRGNKPIPVVEKPAPPTLRQKVTEIIERRMAVGASSDQVIEAVVDAMLDYGVEVDE